MTPKYLIFADGIDVTASFNGRLLSINIKDQAGQESDTLSIEVDDRNGELALPREGALLGAFLGYAETGVYFMGAFTVDEVTSKGGSSGMTLSITARAVKTREAQKEKRSKSYDKKNLGDILAEEAGEHGLTPIVSPDLAGIKYEYLAKRGQSLLDFGTELGLKHDATFKIANNFLIFAKRGSGLSASGIGLPVVPVRRPGNLIDWSIKPKIGRAHYGESAASWYDRDKAKRVVEKVTKGDGPISAATRLRQDKTDAKAAASGDKDDKDRKTGGGSLAIVGNPFVVAETMVMLAGTRAGVDGAWLAKSVEHSFTSSGYVTKLEVETPNKAA